MPRFSGLEAYTERAHGPPLLVASYFAPDLGAYVARVSRDRALLSKQTATHRLDAEARALSAALARLGL